MFAQALSTSITDPKSNQVDSTRPQESNVQNYSKGIELSQMKPPKGSSNHTPRVSVNTSLLSSPPIDSVIDLYEAKTQTQPIDAMNTLVEQKTAKRDSATPLAETDTDIDCGNKTVKLLKSTLSINEVVASSVEGIHNSFNDAKKDNIALQRSVDKEKLLAESENFIQSLKNVLGQEFKYDNLSALGFTKTHNYSSERISIKELWQKPGSNSVIAVLDAKRYQKKYNVPKLDSIHNISQRLRCEIRDLRSSKNSNAKNTGELLFTLRSSFKAIIVK